MRLTFFILALYLLASTQMVAQNLDLQFKAPLAVERAQITTVKEQPDGKLLFGGFLTFFDSKRVNFLTRINANGTRDASFYYDGSVGIAQQIELLSNGDILMLTNAGDIAKLNSRGKVIKYKIVSNLRSILLLTDNSFLVVGGPGGIQKYSSDFVLDPKFNNNANVANDYIFDIERQGNKFIISGTFTNVLGVGKNKVARLNSNGTLDNSFTISSEMESFVNGISVQPDNKILVSNTSGILRFNADGSADEGFHGPSAQILSTVIRGKKIYAFTTNGGYRLNIDGSRDDTFSGEFSFPSRFRLVFALLKNGQIIASNIEYLYGIFKFDVNGNWIPAFQPPIAIDGTIENITQLGKNLAVSGSFMKLNDVWTKNIGLINTKGEVQPEFSFEIDWSRIYDMEALDSEHLLLSSYNYGMILISSGDGEWDWDYFDFDNDFPLNGTPRKFKVLPDNKILMATEHGVARVFPNGERDWSFNSGSHCCGESNTYDFDVDVDGNVVYGAEFGIYNDVVTPNMVRLNKWGQVAQGYYENNVSGGLNGNVTHLTHLPNGEVAATGDFSRFGSTYINSGLVKMKADGTADTKFLENFDDVFIYGLTNVNYFRNKLTIAGYDVRFSTYTVQAIEPNGKRSITKLIPSAVTSISYLSNVYMPDNKTMYVLGYSNVKGKAEPQVIIRITYPSVISDEKPAPELVRLATHNVYPNPTSDFISFDTDVPANIRIFTMDGQIKINSSVKGSSDQVDVRSLKPGRYVVKVIVNGKVTTEHFVVK
jgi:uncharacterized delta-60 repeat protein